MLGSYLHLPVVSAILNRKLLLQEKGAIMVNLFVIGAIFFLLLFFIAIFIAQQFYNVQKVSEAKPKTLIEKLRARGIGALDTDKFKKIVMSSPSEESTGVEPLVERDTLSAEVSDTGKLDVRPEDALFSETMLITGKQLNIENKDLQTIYSEYLTAKNLNPFDVEPDFKLGVAYLRFAQYEKAQKEFQKVIEEKPDFPGIYYYLGEAYRCNGQFYEAMEAYKKSWEMEKLAPSGAEPEEKEKKS